MNEVSEYDAVVNQHKESIRRSAIVRELVESPGWEEVKKLILEDIVIEEQNVLGGNYKDDNAGYVAATRLIKYGAAIDSKIDGVLAAGEEARRELDIIEEENGTASRKPKRQHYHIRW